MRSHNKRCSRRFMDKMNETTDGRCIIQRARERMNKAHGPTSSPLDPESGIRDPVPSGLDQQAIEGTFA